MNDSFRSKASSTRGREDRGWPEALVRMYENKAALIPQQSLRTNFSLIKLFFRAESRSSAAHHVDEGSAETKRLTVTERIRGLSSGYRLSSTTSADRGSRVARVGFD